MEDNEESVLGGDETRRLTHNEIERRRRDNQRDKLDELRSVIPNINDSRPSMIGTLIRAKEYIEALQGRVLELERILAAAATAPPMIPGQSFSGPPGYPPSGAYPGMPHLQPPMDYGMSLGQQFTPKPTPGKRRSSSLERMMNPEADMNPFLGKAFKQGRQGSFANLFSIMEEAHQLSSKAPRGPSDRSGSLERRQGDIDALGYGHADRRDSALLLPTADPNLYLYGHRGSLNNLFAAPLNYILEQQEQPNDPISCHKCKHGIDNLIMIDCDNCHNWYHIRCIGMESENIPIKWICSECPKTVTVPGA